MITPVDLLAKVSLDNNKMGFVMEDNSKSEVSYSPQDHPWVEMPIDDSVDEEIRYSLDEIRIG